MENASRRRLERWALQSAARDLMSDERVAWCLRRPGFDPETRRSFREIKVMYSARVHRAHYKNLAVCGSVWMCPICSAKITERRRIELTQAIELHDFKLGLSTFTLQHSFDDKLSVVLLAELEAYRYLKKHRVWTEFCGDYKLMGSVRSLETTYGVNGWHPHLHVLNFFQPGANLRGIEGDLKNLWRSSIEHFGRSASWQRGVDFRSAEKDIADYVSKFGHEPVSLKRPYKWTIEHELTKSQTKISRVSGGCTPLQLLADHLNGEKVLGRDPGKLWQEYARVFKGKRQLVWSHGLRALLGLGRDQTDEEIAKREDEQAVLLAALSLRQWRIVLGNDARGEVLEIASSGDPDKLQAFLHRLGAGKVLRSAGLDDLRRLQEFLNRAGAQEGENV